MEEYITHSRDETVALGRRLAAELAPGQPDCLYRRAGRWQNRVLPGHCRGPLAARTLFPAQPLPLSTTTAARGPLPILICTASIPKWTFLPPVFMITWIWALWLRRNGAKTAPTCWRWKTRFILTLIGWMKPPARLPSPGLWLDVTPFWKGRADPE